MRERKHFQRSRTTRAVIRALGDMPRVPAPDGFSEAVMAALAAGVPVELEVEEEARGHRALLWVAGGAGLVGVGVAVTLAVWRHLAGHGEDGVAAIGSA